VGAQVEQKESWEARGAKVPGVDRELGKDLTDNRSTLWPANLFDGPVRNIAEVGDPAIPPTEGFFSRKITVGRARRKFLQTSGNA